MKRKYPNKFKYKVVLINNMTLEMDVLVAISLAAVAKTVIFVIVINFFSGRKDKPKEYNSSKNYVNFKFILSLSKFINGGIR